MDYAAAGIFGALVGLGELVSRYRDAPGRALAKSPSAWFYCILNAAMSMLALRLIDAFGLTFGKTGSALEWTRVLVAGVGAIAFFRTSLFTLRIGDKDVGVGPVSFLQVMLESLDRAVDRRRASGRAGEAEIMTGLSFDKAVVSLATYCLALVQNLSKDEQQRVGESIKVLQASNMAEDAKLRILGVYLINAVGPDTLKVAIQSLGPAIRP